MLITGLLLMNYDFELSVQQIFSSIVRLVDPRCLTLLMNICCKQLPIHSQIDPLT